MHNNNNYYYYQCKMCWNKALTFGVGSIKLSFRDIVFTQYMHVKMFSIQMFLYTFQSNCAEGLHFSAFHSLLTVDKAFTTKTCIMKTCNYNKKIKNMTSGTGKNKT